MLNDKKYYFCLSPSTLPKKSNSICDHWSIGFIIKSFFLSNSDENVIYHICFILGFPEDHFTHLFLDEAGHATEPEAIIPLAKILSKKGQMVLAGKCWYLFIRFSVLCPIMFTNIFLRPFIIKFN